MLQAVRDEGAWETWLAFFLAGVKEVSDQAADTARKILILRENHRRVITDSLGRAAGNGHRTLDHLYEHPIVAVSDVEKLTGTTYQAANDLVARLVDEGILQEFTGQARNRRFRYQSYIELFNDADTDSES